MAQITGLGTTFNLPNYFGLLATADLTNFPFLQMAGGINGGMSTQNQDFATSSEYDFPAAAQPAITENASVTAPAATQFVRTQVENTTQIFQQAVNLTYQKLSNSNRLSGLNTAGMSNNVEDELDAQIMYNMQIIARQIEYSFLRGAYQKAVDADTAAKTRGMLSVAELTGSTNIAAGGVAISKTLMDTFFRTLIENGAFWNRPTLWVSPIKKQQVTALYEVLPRDRYEGGSNVQTIVTDFGNVDVMPAHRFMPNTDILFADMAFVNLVGQPVPGKGVMFYEPLSKTGAAETGQVYGQVGLDHGPAFMHGKISGLI